MVGCIKIPLGMEVGLSLADFVLDGDPGTPPQKGVEPQFSAHIYCGQTAAWIKMPLGTAVGLGLRDIVLDGDPALPPLKGHSPQFSANVHCVQMAGWMKTPLGAEVDLGTRAVARILFQPRQRGKPGVWGRSPQRDSGQSRWSGG